MSNPTLPPTPDSSQSLAQLLVCIEYLDDFFAGGEGADVQWILREVAGELGCRFEQLALEVGHA